MALQAGVLAIPDQSSRKQENAAGGEDLCCNGMSGARCAAFRVGRTGQICAPAHCRVGHHGDDGIPGHSGSASCSARCSGLSRGADKGPYLPVNRIGHGMNGSSAMSGLRLPGHSRFPGDPCAEPTCGVEPLTALLRNSPIIAGICPGVNRLCRLLTGFSQKPR